MFGSFRNACRGLGRILAEKMFLVELACGLVAIAFTWLFGNFSMFEKLIVITFVFMVLCFEGINTAIEKLLDFLSPKYNREVGIIKDMIAGTVLLGIIGAFAVGLLIALRMLGVVL